MDLFMLVTVSTIAYKYFRMMSSVDNITYWECVVLEYIAYSFGLNIYCNSRPVARTFKRGVTWMSDVLHA